jgi:ribosomal protein L37AE/L43A
MSKNLKILTGSALALAAVVMLWINLRPDSDSVDNSQASVWTCKSCGNQFKVTLRDLNNFQAKHYGEPYPCPKCGSTDILREARKGDARGEPEKQQ